jgi:hypothetical protein
MVANDAAGVNQVTHRHRVCEKSGRAGLGNKQAESDGWTRAQMLPIGGDLRGARAADERKDEMAPCGHDLGSGATAWHRQVTTPAVLNACTPCALGITRFIPRWRSHPADGLDQQLLVRSPGGRNRATQPQQARSRPPSGRMDNTWRGKLFPSRPPIASELCWAGRRRRRGAGGSPPRRSATIVRPRGHPMRKVMCCSRAACTVATSAWTGPGSTPCGV